MTVESGEVVAGRRVLVVDDHPLFRRGLLSVLAGEPWIEAVAEAGCAREAIEVCAQQRPDVAVVDIRLPDRDGVTLTGQILRAHPRVGVLLLTMLDRADLVLDGLRAGARGYVLKNSGAQAIVDALRTVADGGLVLGPGVPSPLSDAGSATQGPAPFDRLSRREREVAAEVANGGTNLQIARRLGLSEKTVRNMVSSILAATGTRHRIALALLAHEHGLVRPDRGRIPPEGGGLRPGRGGLRPEGGGLRPERGLVRPGPRPPDGGPSG